MAPKTIADTAASANELSVQQEVIVVSLWVNFDFFKRNNQPAGTATK